MNEYRQIYRCSTDRRRVFAGTVALIWIISSTIVFMVTRKTYTMVRKAPSPLESPTIEVIKPKGSFLGETSADTSTYYLLNTDSISLGDTLYVRIEARDRYNQSRTVGGDFWYTWLSSAKDPKASTPGQITDYDNGIYMVEFPVVWSGVAHINIIMVHPSDATRFLKNIVWNSENRIFWRAVFVGGNSKTQNVSCTLESPGIWQNKCAYPYPRANGRTTLVCDKPPDLPCNTILAYKADSARINEEVAKLCKGKEFLFQGKAFEQKIGGSISSVHVKESTSLVFQPAGELPNCKPGVHTLGSKGYWLNYRWNPLNCRKYNCWQNDTLIGECLRNQEIFILGDSNGRQYLTLLNDIFNKLSKLNATDINPYNESLKYDFPYNVSMKYVFHPEAISGNYIPLYALKYEVDMLDTLTNRECNYIVILSVWAHFSQWPRDAFYERLLRLRKAVLRLRKRCPNVPIFLKSPHPREHTSLSSTIYTNDFILYGIRNMLLEVFGETGIMFLDIWGMNMAYYSPNHVHMPYVVVNEELFMIYSTICGSMCTD